MDVLGDLRKLLSDELDIPEDELLQGKTFSELGADSLDFFQVIFSVQDHFGIELTDDELSAVETFDDLNILISKRVAARVQI